MTDLSRNVSSHFSTGTYQESDAAWSPDGDAIAFASVRSDGKAIYRKPSAGGSESMVLHLEQNGHGLDDWSRDGRFLLYHVTNEERALPLSGDRAPITVVSGVTRPDEAAFSPDGRLVALNADESARTEVYLTTFPPTGQRWQVSDAGGAQPRWRGDGRELYYLALDGSMMAVAVGSGPKPDLSAPRKLFSTRISVRTGTEQYAVTADGQRFLMMMPSENARTELRAILNWPSLVPAK
jgi:Tol biopolymer transport system component